MFCTDTQLEYSHYRLEYLSSAASFDTYLLSESLALAYQGHLIEERAGYLFQNLMHFHFQLLPLLHLSDSFYSKFVQRLSSHRKTKLAGVHVYTFVLGNKNATNSAR